MRKIKVRSDYEELFYEYMNHDDSGEYSLLENKEMDINDYQFEVDGAQYSVDGVAFFRNGKVHVEIGALYFGSILRDDWIMIGNIKRLRQSEKYLEASEDFLDFLYQINA